ncbi:MAG TPA: cupredoxin domain-containing protein [Actinomycetota bacterium]
MRIVTGIVIAALAVGGIACSGDEVEPPPCPNPTQATTVVMDDFSYGPNCLAVDADAIVSLDNQGAAPHTFTIEGTGVDADVAAGEQGSADLAGVAPGAYTVTCTYHPQMLAVVEVAG